MRYLVLSANLKKLNGRVSGFISTSRENRSTSEVFPPVWNRTISLVAPRIGFQPASCFPPRDFGERVATADPMQEAKGVKDVALSAGVGADDHRELADVQRLVGKVLEILQAEET